MQAQDTHNEQDQVALPLRPHTILGVCEAIGEDFGFNPVWLRIPLAASVLVSPTMAIGAYFVLAAIVLASRLLFPTARPAMLADPAEGNAEGSVANDAARTEMAQAA